jgi:hypothetical protein
MDGKTCKIENQQPTYPDKFTVALAGGDKASPPAGLAVVSLAKGKTLFDLNQWEEATLPPWAKAEATLDARPGARAQGTVDVQSDTLFVLCYMGDPKAPAGVLGPIKVMLPAGKVPPTPTVAPAPTLPPSDMTVKITNGTCELQSPNKSYPAKFTVTYVGGDKPNTEWGLTFISMPPGKTLQDLTGTATGQPSWVTVEGSIGTSTGVSTRDTISVKANPIYVICFEVNGQGGLTRIGRFGPIEIAK